MRLKPSDVAILIDRLLVLFERPARTSEGRDPNLRSELPIDVLNRVEEETRGDGSTTDIPLPRTRRLDDRRRADGARDSRREPHRSDDYLAPGTTK
jgi:hypothetical protein